MTERVELVRCSCCAKEFEDSVLHEHRSPRYREVVVYLCDLCADTAKGAEYIDALYD
jgi:hypothetical protein